MCALSTSLPDPDTGSRLDIILAVLKPLPRSDILIVGDCRTGLDNLVYDNARELGFIHIFQFKTMGRSPTTRNESMVDVVGEFFDSGFDAHVHTFALPLPIKNDGTRNTARLARGYKLPVSDHGESTR